MIEKSYSRLLYDNSYRFGTIISAVCHFKAVFHNLTVERGGPPTIKNNIPFHLTSPEWEDHEDKWNRQGGVLTLHSFEQV